MRTTQKQNILRHLLAGPLCGVEDDWEYGRRIAARIHELRVKGFPIETRQCRGSDHLTYQIEYVLDRDSHWNETVADWCADCGPLGDFRYVGDGVELDGLIIVRCDRCGKKDYR